MDSNNNFSFKRRQLVTGIGAALAASPFASHAAMGPNDKFDLVIKGGEVIDRRERRVVHEFRLPCLRE